MRSLLLLLISIGILSVANQADAQHHAYSPVVPIVRYNTVAVPVYRHYEDTRRYNAAPNRYGYRAPARVTTTQTTSSCACAPKKLRTEVVSQRCQPTFYYDSCGRRLCRHVTVTIYKDIYSNGSCRIWQHIST